MKPLAISTSLLISAVALASASPRSSSSSFLCSPHAKASSASTSTSTTSFACTSNIDCQLNGQCNIGNGSCLCRPGWVGIDCGLLDFLPAPLVKQGAAGFYRNDTATWGGSIVQEESDGKYYMFLAYMTHNCGLNSWQQNSAIYRAVSATSSPIGPYVNETLITTYFAHNPSASRHPDGTLLVWMIGSSQGGDNYVKGCTNGTTPPPPPPPPVQFKNDQGNCLTGSGTFPCWTGQQNWTVCPVVAGSCTSNQSYWSVEGNEFIASKIEGNPAINLDCNQCTTGRVAKVFSAGGSPLKYNSSSKQIMATNCDGSGGSSGNTSMCLSNGVVVGAQPPCGGGSEPYSATQVHLRPCSDPATIGWVLQSSSSSLVGEGGEEEYTADVSLDTTTTSSSSSTWPLPATDSNIMVSESGSVFGPWYFSGMLEGNRSLPFVHEIDNPAPLVFENGTTWVMFRSWNPPGNSTTPIGIARSDTNSWNSTYTLTTQPVPIGFPNTTEYTYVPLEDPFLWRDNTSGTFHALFHNMGGCNAVGCHAFSEDGFLWFLATSNPYTTTLNYTDGSSVNLGRRERPHILFNSQGDPAFLTNGIQDTWSDDHSYTMIQQINVDFP